MKIKIVIYLFLYLICFNSILLSDQIIFDSDNIKIKDDGNMIFATKGIAKIPSQDIEIEGDKSIYNKLISELTIIDNVKFFDKKKDIYIESDNVIFDQIKNIVYSYGETYIEVESKYEIISDNVVYDRNTMQISSLEYTTIDDSNDNEFNFEDGFLFDNKVEVISSKRTNIIDNNDNHYFFENAKLNLKTNEIVGKEVIVDFRDSYFGNEKNDPILKGKSTTSDNDKTRIYKAVFSTCSMENKKCRGWELQSETFTHDKVKKLFKYKNSWLKVFNYKVFYTPYLSHPDPTVKRKSGFLTPSYKNSDNLGFSVNVPYFYAPSKSRDFTFNPRIYTDSDFIIQTEYRENFKKSNIVADMSFNRNEDNTNTHLFAKINGELDEKTGYAFKFQNVSNDDYLQIHELMYTTPLIDSYTTMTSSFDISRSIDKNTNLSSSFLVYEDLSQEKNSDRYQYVFPSYSFDKKIEIDESYHGNFTFLSSGFQKKYSTNIYEAQVNNDFKFDSFDFISDFGIVTDYNLLLKNYNTYSENSNQYEKKNDHKLFPSLLVTSDFPLKKELENSTNYFKPKIQARFSPVKGKDISDENFLMNYGTIFSSNRIGRSDMVEEGKSLTIGAEFSKENLLNDKILGANIGTILKDEKNDRLPSRSKLDQTRSDIVGDISYNFNKFNLKYSFIYDRDLDYSNYDAISAKYNSNNFVTSFNYITENHDLGNSESIVNNTKISFDEHSLNFNTAKNLIDDFTQFYNFVYEYNTDCLSLQLDYNRKFFRSGRLVPHETLTFYVRFIPFVQIWGSADETLNYFRNK